MLSCPAIPLHVHVCTCTHVYAHTHTHTHIFLIHEDHVKLMFYVELFSYFSSCK